MNMSGKTHKKVLFIINPVSGVSNSKKAGIEKAAMEHLDASEYAVEFVYTESSNHAFELSRDASMAGVNIIVAVGGDGTANRVIKGLFGSTSIFALVPAGSGNGLARYLNVPLDVDESIKLIAKGKTRDIDTVTVNDEIFASIAGVGFDALVAKKFANAGRRGFFSYFHIALQAYPSYRPRKYKMVIDGKTVNRKALFVSFANSNQFGYNTVISPAASIEDGLVDVCIVQKAPVISAPYILGLLWRNKLDTSGYLEIIKAKEVTLLRSKNRKINLDGEPMKVGKDLNIRVNPGSLKIIVP